MRTTCAEAEQALLRRAAPGAPDECWEWPGARTPRGYGRVTFRGRVKYAHRLSHEAFIGPLADGELACHACDNPPCWNPAHLFAGSHTDNNRDRQAKGRSQRGEGHYAAKLTEDDVRAIRASDLSGPALGERYGVSPFTIYKILDRRSWAHVDPIKSDS